VTLRPGLTRSTTRRRNSATASIEKAWRGFVLSNPGSVKRTHR
jgi:hypothetical protein